MGSRCQGEFKASAERVFAPVGADACRRGNYSLKIQQAARKNRIRKLDQNRTIEDVAIARR